MVGIEVTETEYRLLGVYKMESPYSLVRLKAMAIMLLSSGVDMATISKFVDRKPSTITTWCKDWQERRMSSMYTGHAGNQNASTLTSTQRREIDMILAQPPSEMGLPGEFWDIPAVSHLVYASFGVTYESDSSYHFLLRHAGLSFHKPEAHDKRRADEAVIGARMSEIRQEFIPALHDPHSIVFASDEVRIEHEAVLRRAWYKRGTKTTLKVDRESHHQSYIGFLNQNTGECLLHRLSHQKSDLIIDALTHLTKQYPGKHITIVWDNASFHRSQELRKLLGPGNTLENIHLINMPAYAPDHNPIEHVWAEAKNNISNEQRDTFNHTRQAFEEFITKNKFPYRINKDFE